MKTLRGMPIEGNLLKLYNYYFAPDGGEEEAFQLAEANKLSRQFRQLINQQASDVDLIFNCLFNWTQGEIQTAEGEPIADIFTLRNDTMLTLLSHNQTGVYEFEVRIKASVKVGLCVKVGVFEVIRPVCFAVRQQIENSNDYSYVYLDKDSLPAYILENEDQRAKLENLAKTVADGIHSALIKLTEAPAVGGRRLDAKNISIKTNLDDYPKISYDTNL